MTSLNSKCYIGCGNENKTSCKEVIQKQNLLDVDCFNLVLDTKETLHVTNTGFKVLDHHIVTYKQKKRGLNYQYIKKKNMRGRREHITFRSMTTFFLPSVYVLNIHSLLNKIS